MQKTKAQRSSDIVTKAVLVVNSCGERTLANRAKEHQTKPGQTNQHRSEVFDLSARPVGIAVDFASIIVSVGDKFCEGRILNRRNARAITCSGEGLVILIS